MSDTTATPKPRAAGARKGGVKAAGAVKRARPAGAAAGKQAAAAKAAPVPVTGPVEGGILKPKELLTRVLARSGANRVAARPVIEAVLTELAESLARGESFVLPPLGKGKIRPRKEGAKETAGVTLKLTPAKAKKDGDTPLAPAEE